MAAPGNVRVEAESQTSVRLRWTYGGSLFVAVYQSTDGSSYAVTSTQPESSTAVEFEVTGLTAGTRYWYKLSEDGGANFSSVVTVYTHACPTAEAPKTDLTLPRSESGDVSGETFDELANKVESALVRYNSPDERSCVVCVVDGAIAIDCIDYDGCDSITVNVDADINSISLPNCDDSVIDIQFVVPPGVTRKVCGWPRGSGFTGDECYQAPIVGGTAGKIVTASVRQGMSGGGSTGKSRNANTVKGTPGGGGGGGGSDCMCIPGSKGELTIKSCNANNSLKCTTTKSLKLIACGGKSPYIWSNTGTLTLSKTTGDTTTITPPANTGTAVVGTAYNQVKNFGYCFNSSPTCGPSCGPVAGQAWTKYGCNDQVTDPGGTADATGDPTGCGVGFQGTCVDGTCTDCVNGNCRVGFGTCSANRVWPSAASANAALLPVSGGIVCDKRTAGMIAAGCVPCGIAGGSTVSVTDAVGTVVTIVLTA